MREVIWQSHLCLGEVKIPVIICPAQLYEKGPVLGTPENADTTPTAWLADAETSAMEDCESARPGEDCPAIDLLSFVNQTALAPVPYERPCLVLPHPEAAVILALLCRVLRQSQKTGIAQIRIGSQHQLVALRLYGPVLLLQPFRCAEILTDSREFDVLAPIPRLPRRRALPGSPRFSRIISPRLL